jgi:hypothetical protein
MSPRRSLTCLGEQLKPLSPPENMVVPYNILNLYFIGNIVVPWGTIYAKKQFKPKSNLSPFLLREYSCSLGHLKPLLLQKHGCSLGAI